MARRLEDSSPLITALITCVAVVASGCVRSDSPQSQRTSENTAPQHHTSPWRTVSTGDHIIAMPENDADLLAEATAEAQRSAEDARTRWQVATPEQKLNWSIKWAARTLEGGIEHLWVRPTHWSQWRIEGVLLSEPTRELESGASTGDAVSFPVDELTDWLYLIEGATDGPRHGGYTMDALTERFGRPSS